MLVDNQCPGDVGYDLNGIVNNGEYCRGVGTCNTNGLQNCTSCTGSEIDLDADGQTADDGDCDDTDPTVYLGAPELCDGEDNNCDGVTPVTEVDNDADGYVECWPSPGVTFNPVSITGGGDCDDALSAINPGATEISDGGDNDCDATTFHPDEVDDDWDCQCEDPSAANCVLNTAASCATMTGDDCDDTNALIFTGASEVCDGLDNDCDGSVGDGTSGNPDEDDEDGDGYSPCLDGDCVDDAVTLAADYLTERGTVYPGGNALIAAASIHPGAENFCDGWINDCSGNGGVDYLPDASNQPDEFDDDGDGFVECTDTIGLATFAWGDNSITADAGLTGGNDCADVAADTPGFATADHEDIFPGATEVCDGFDNDCLGTVGALYLPTTGVETDDDNDDYIECGVDVNGGNTNPAGGFVDNGALLTGGADCDDAVGTINPGEVDDYGTNAISQGVDNDCDTTVDEDSLAAGDLLITEFDHAPSASVDWFEVYNQSSQPIDLFNWEISDNAGTEEIDASHGSMVVAAGSYAVICLNASLGPAGATCLNSANINGLSFTGNDELELIAPFVGGSPGAGSNLAVDFIDWGSGQIATNSTGSVGFDPALLTAGTVLAGTNDLAANWCASFTPQTGSGNFGTP
ncbi:MAG: MopE-related protein, partial [Acidobacteriota bacterium]